MGEIMNIRDITKVKKFTPVTIKLTFESQKELEEFYSIFNSAVIAKYAKHLPFQNIRIIIKKYIKDAEQLCLYALKD
jgi:hypothetical protein